MKLAKAFLITFIVIGVSLLLTEKGLVPKIVSNAMSHEDKTKDGVLTNLPTLPSPPTTYEDCISQGGKDYTPQFNGPEKCILNNHIYENLCVSNDKFIVIAQYVDDGVGANFVSKHRMLPKTKVSCTYSVSPGDFFIKNEWAEYLLALEGNFLILDSGTGPNPRGIIVYDLTLQKKVFTDRYSEPISIKDSIITYWSPTDIKPTYDNCPTLTQIEADQMGSLIETHVTLDLKTLTKKSLGENRCIETD